MLKQNAGKRQLVLPFCLTLRRFARWAVLMCRLSLKRSQVCHLAQAIASCKHRHLTLVTHARNLFTVGIYAWIMSACGGSAWTNCGGASTAADHYEEPRSALTG